MIAREAVIAKIQQAFGQNDYPGDAYLQGNFEGCEPSEEVGPFRGKQDWGELAPDFLDARGAALSFFSEAGLRFFLPAYLIADLEGRLHQADPLFHLTHGFLDESVEIPKKNRTFTIRFGKSKLINPRRYGAATTFDYARCRLAVFTREEAQAIVAYLQYRQQNDDLGLETARINAALAHFWLERARSAPTAADLRRHLEAEEDYLAAIREETADS